MAKNYDENAKKPDRDPRNQFKNPIENTTAGVVGPMGTSAFNLPHVERALTDMEGSVVANPLNMSTSGATKPTRTTRPVVPSGPGAASAANPRAALGQSTGTSPQLAATPSPTGGQTQHEVLQNFFQSLLSSKDRAAGTSPNSKARPASPKPAENGNDNESTSPGSVSAGDTNS